MGLIGVIVKVVVLLLLAVVGLGAFLYFTDYEAQGTVTDKGTDSGGAFVVIQPKLIPYKVTQHLDSDAARFICKDYQVTFKIQSRHYTVSDAAGELVYDSTKGLVRPPTALVECPRV